MVRAASNRCSNVAPASMSGMSNAKEEPAIAASSNEKAPSPVVCAPVVSVISSDKDRRGRLPNRSLGSSASARRKRPS
eukprot:scaffold156046_cov29-Tisochrysis_lutea.AAC.5